MTLVLSLVSNVSITVQNFGNKDFTADMTLVLSLVSNVNTTLRNFGLHECLETTCTYTSKSFMHILSWRTSVTLSA